MKRTAGITDTELELLKQLWDRPSMTARELAEACYGECTTSTIGTVQKLIQRLENKGYIKRDRRDFAHRFSAKVSRSSVAGSQLDALAKRVSDGSLAPFITHLVKAKRLSEAEKESIRKLLEDQEPNP